MTGGALAIFLMWWGFYYKKFPPAGIFWAFVATYFFVSAFGLWRKERGPFSPLIERDVDEKMKLFNRFRQDLLGKLAIPTKIKPRDLDTEMALEDIREKTGWLFYDQSGVYEIQTAFLKPIQRWFAKQSKLPPVVHPIPKHDP